MKTEIPRIYYTRKQAAEHLQMDVPTIARRKSKLGMKGKIHYKDLNKLK